MSGMRVTSTLHTALISNDRLSTQPERTTTAKPSQSLRGQTNASLAVAMFYTFLTVTSYLIVLPTNQRYMEKLGADSRLTGLAVGVMPFGTGLVQIPLVWMLRRVPLKRVYLGFTLLLIVSQVLYALAGVVNSVGILLLGRALAGFVAGPQCLTTFVARAVPEERRSAVMIVAGISIAGGYAAGVLFGGLLDLVPSDHALGTVAAAYNGESLPGWVMAALAGVELLLLLCLFDDPPRPEQSAASIQPVPTSPMREATLTTPTTHESVTNSPPAGSKAGTGERGAPATALAACLGFSLIVPMNIAAAEVFASTAMQNLWGWTAGQAALFLGLALATVVPLMALNLTALLTERNGMLACVAAGAVGLALFLAVQDLPLVRPEAAAPNEPASSPGLRIGVFALGLVIFLNAMQLGRQFTWAMLLKLTPPKDRPLTLGVNAMLYMLGRGIGATVQPFFPDTNSYVAIFLGLTAAAWLFTAGASCAGDLDSRVGATSRRDPPRDQRTSTTTIDVEAPRRPSLSLAYPPASPITPGVPLSRQPIGSFSLSAMASHARQAVHVLGTGAAFGNTYTTEQMLAAFKRQRAADGDDTCDFGFAERVFRACGFDGHSVTLDEKDLFRTMSRAEYLQLRMTNMVDLAQRACEAALAHWGGDRSTITHLYWGTMTGAMHSPTIDIALVDRLGLSPDVERTSIEGMGCLTGFRLLNLARHAAAACPHPRVLVIEADLRSALGNALPKHAARSDIVSVALFRDAASACVLGGGALRPTEVAYYEAVCGRSRIVPGSRELVDYREGDCGEIGLHIDKKLPDAVAAAEPAFVAALLRDAAAAGASPPTAPGLPEFNIACHTGGPRVLHEVANALGAADEQLASSWAVMKARGNLSGASNLAVLDHLNRATVEGAPDRVEPAASRRWVICLSMGPGACLEGVVLRRPLPKALAGLPRSLCATPDISPGRGFRPRADTAMSEEGAHKWLEAVASSSELNGSSEDDGDAGK